VRKDPRHRAREAALQILYQWEVGGVDVAQAATVLFERQWADPEPAPAALRSFASALAADTVGLLARSDALIAETSEKWRPERMAIVDRLILRLAIAEMIRDESTPRPVIIDEALELAKTFSTAESARFINGMLDAIRKKLG
jgi:N utilization substance protein B